MEAVMTGRAVVVVADDPDRQSVRTQLESLGYQVLDATDGASAFVQAQLHHPAVVLLDIDTLGARGYDALESLQSDEQVTIPVIIVTSDLTTERVVEGLRRGAYDYLRKPLATAELLARIRAAERARLLKDELRTRNSQLRELVRMDVLTGLYNRRHLDEYLNMVASGALRLRMAFSLLMVDIDHFKRINDDYGHVAGDEVLRTVAGRVAFALRGEDIAGRWGGEEFLVVLPHTPLDGAWRLADRIRQRVCGTPVALGGDRDVLVTVSIGCGEGYGDDIEDHVRRTEAALYDAKSGGRNRVVADTTAVVP